MDQRKDEGRRTKDEGRRTKDEGRKDDGGEEWLHNQPGPANRTY